MDDEKWLCGWRYARDLDFTFAQYEEAVKRTDTPDNANQLLVALIDVSRRSDTCCTTSNQVTAPGDAELINNNSTPSYNDKESSSSCYSSINSFPSSSDQSLESISQQQSKSLRKIYIDGSNIARSHAKDASFSWLGIKLCVEWFHSRGHSVKVFVPQDRCQLADESILRFLRDLDALVETPIGCNDDIFVIEAARHNNGIIVSNDLFRDEKRFNDELQRFIHLNRLPYAFCNDLFIPASDPCGRSGPKLEDFLNTEFINQGIQLQSRLLGRTKSHQRYQRKKEYPSQHFNIYQRNALHSTRSLPIEQNKLVVNNNIQQSTTSANVSHYQRFSNQDTKNISDNHHPQVRRTISVVCANSNTKESDVQPMAGRSRTVLYRTKSHNV